MNYSESFEAGVMHFWDYFARTLELDLVDAELFNGIRRDGGDDTERVWE